MKREMVVRFWNEDKGLFLKLDEQNNVVSE
jgi:hypothetical protein